MSTRNLAGLDWSRRVAVRVSGRNRQRKLRLFMDTFCPDKATTVLDVGFAEGSWMPDANYLEQHYPWPGRLTALSVDEPLEGPRLYPAVEFVQYDGRRFPFDDGQFDIARSNAVLEHVGGHERQVLFVSELRRVAKAVWLTTPNRGFPIDSHSLIPLAHWLPAGARDRVYLCFGKTWATSEFCNLLYRSDLERLLHEAGAGQFRITTNRLMGWPLEFVVVIDGPATGGRRAAHPGRG